MIKTITSDSAEEFDKLVNEYEKTVNVFATQTHVNKESGMTIQYTAVVFSRGKSDYNKS